LDAEPGKDALRETTMEALEAAKARWEVFNLGESHGGSSIILNSWLVYFMEKNDHEG
jgi:hypothetical protein